jgi:hypothetical protein
MGFMQKQITEKQAWIRVETSYGTEFIDAASLGLNVRDSQTKTHKLTPKVRESIISLLSEYCEGTIQEWETIRGYGARLSAPGYLDCTEWTVFDTLEEAEEYLEEMYGDEEGD